jgi:hypothetical protein
MSEVMLKSSQMVSILGIDLEEIINAALNDDMDYLMELLEEQEVELEK